MAEARNAIRDLAEENEKLSNELAWFRRQLFGSKTEHYIPRDDTPSLFPEEMSPESPKEVPTATVAEHERKVRQANALSEIPADLPREERVIDVPEEERLGMVLIGYEESERIAYRTGLYVIHFKRAKYADSSDTLRGVVTAPAPGDVFDSVSGRTRYDASFIAKVVADKVENAIPLERQARMFGNERLPVAPSTLEDLYKRTADALQPLYERMVDRIMQCDILHVDETFIKQLVKGAKKCKQAYLWCRLTGVGPPMTAYHFSPSRSRDVAESLLGDYSGTIIRDSYVAYEKLDCEVACCWAAMIAITTRSSIRVKYLLIFSPHAFFSTFIGYLPFHIRQEPVRTQRQPVRWIPHEKTVIQRPSIADRRSTSPLFRPSTPARAAPGR